MGRMKPRTVLGDGAAHTPPDAYYAHDVGHGVGLSFNTRTPPHSDAGALAPSTTHQSYHRAYGLNSGGEGGYRYRYR